MKKRLFGTITAASLLAAMPINSAYSADEDTNPLRELANQLGWETDYFTFANYSTLAVNNKTDKSYLEYLNSCTNAEIASDPLNYYCGILNSGRCVGISILEILSHNDMIKPSDIQPGSEFLTDITLDNNDVKKILEKYQLLQNYTEFDLYMKWYLTHYSTEEKVKMLLDTAERSMEEGKYFLMVYDAPGVTATSKQFFHAVTGIGIADGNWTFNDEQYDKCILTYDSNGIKAEFWPQETVAWGFMEELSIYVNTEKNKLYVPGYELTSDDGLTFFATADETLLNYKGAINPSETINTDLSLLNKIKVDKNAEYSVIAQRPDGTSYDVIAESFESKLTKDFNTYYFDGSDVVIENAGGADFNTSITNTAHTVNISGDSNVKTVFKDAAKVDISGNGKNAGYSVDIILNEGNYEFSPHYRWIFDGVTDGNISVKQVDRGIILDSDGNISTKIEINDIKRDENENLVNTADKTYLDSLQTPEKVLISFDKNGDLKYYIGENFANEVEKGDVNCDGKIDASDASNILSAYADYSTGRTSYVSNILGDFNNDGKIDASDASDVLCLYAKLSTQKN